MKTSEIKMKPGGFRLIRHQQGAAAVEMALILPVLLVLVLGLYEFSRAISFNNIITNLSREGANLASRTGTSPAEIMDALAQTAGQVNLRDNGTIYVTRILQTTIGGSDKDAQVLAQYRWSNSALENPPDSRLWSCEANGSSQWAGGECNIQPALQSRNRTASLDMTLNDNEEVVAVEVYYVYRPAFQFLLKKDLPLYSLTLL